MPRNYKTFILCFLAVSVISYAMYGSYDEDSWLERGVYLSVILACLITPFYEIWYNKKYQENTSEEKID